MVVRLILTQGLLGQLLDFRRVGNQSPVKQLLDGRGDELWALVQTLPRKARAVVVLRYYEEMTEAETADVLGISVGTVKSQASRALATLRERTPATLNPREEER